MLRLAKIGSGGEAYYLGVAAGSGTGVEPAGRWVGAGAAGMGLGGDVRAEALELVLAGRSPETHDSLGRADGRIRVSAFDLTFAAPKSVSILHALATPDVAAEVAAGHRAAVEASIDYVERRAAAVRRPANAFRLPVPVDGLVASAFEHRTSRALDPHLHTHVVVANLASGQGRWSALDGRGLYTHRATADACYHAQLRFELTKRLGVDWSPGRNGRADLVGIGPEVRAQFSRRSAAIAARLDVMASRGFAATELAARTTRPPKDPTVSPEALRPDWADRARQVGLGPGRLEAVMGRLPGHRAGLVVDDVGAEVRRALVTAGHPFSRRDVVRLWGSALPRGGPVRTFEAEADNLLGAMAPGYEGREAPGVAEGRYFPAARDRDLARRLDQVVDRQVVLARDEAGTSRWLQRSVGYDLGLG